MDIADQAFHGIDLSTGTELRRGKWTPEEEKYSNKIIVSWFGPAVGDQIMRNRVWILFIYWHCLFIGAVWCRKSADTERNHVAISPVRETAMVRSYFSSHYCPPSFSTIPLSFDIPLLIILCFVFVLLFLWNTPLKIIATTKAVRCASRRNMQETAALARRCLPGAPRRIRRRNLQS